MLDSFFLTKVKASTFKWSIKTNFHYLICIVLVVSNNYNLFSQTLAFDRFTTKDGLLSEDVYNLHQDKLGYLWVFSKYGTLKYNGSNFKPVLKNLPFKEAFVYCIYENEKGEKWVANSNARIYEVKNDSAYLVKGIEDVSEDLRRRVSEVSKLYVDDSLNIYVITKGYSYKLLNRSGTYRAINLSESFTADSVIYNIIDQNKDIHVIANRDMVDGLKYINKPESKSYIEVTRGEKKTVIRNPFYNVGAQVQNTSIRNLKKINNRYYFLYANLFFNLNQKDSLSFTRLKSLAINFTKDKYDHFWVGCLNDGVYELNENGVVLNHYLEGITINDVLFDHQGGLWLSSAGSGLFHCEDIQEVSFKSKDFLGSSIGAIKILDSTVYVLNKHGGIFATNDDKFYRISNKNNKEVYDIEKQDEKLVISSISIHFEQEAWNKNLKSTFAGFNPMCYNLVSKSRDTLIASTRQCVIYIVRGKSIKVNYFYAKITTLALYNKLLWLGTDNGVYSIPAGFKNPSRTHNRVLVFDTIDIKKIGVEGTKGINISKIVKSEFGLWFCSQGNGLFLYKDGKLINYTKESEFPDNVINDFFITTDGVALVSSNSGLYLTKFLSKKNDFERWEKIHTGEVKQAVLFKNNIYIGTSEGLIILKYENSLKRNDKIFFNLASITVDGIPVNPSHFYTIKSNQRTIEFDFDFINYTKDKSPIRFSLNGKQLDSGYIENAHLRFSQLAPGNYSLTAYPDERLGRLAQIVIPFRVEPAFWQTAEFIISIVVGILLIVVFVFLLILRRNKKRQALKTKNEQLILEYKLIALKAQINPHFMSNCLSAIQDLVLNGKNDRATFYIAQFGLMVRQILDFSSKQLITLKEELDLLEIYVELEQLRFENKFEYCVEIENDISLKETYLPPLIFNPLVENAIWHGLLPMQHQKEGRLVITIKRRENNLELCVEDNGVGRDFQKSKSANNKNKSYGIQITEQRLANINYLNNRNDARLVYNDLKDSTNSSCGTLVRMYLPNNLNPFQNEQD